MAHQKAEYDEGADYEGGPVDLDEILFEQHVSKRKGLAIDDDDGSLFGDEEEQALLHSAKTHESELYRNPDRRLLDRDASQIPGSPFSKPPVKKSTRPTEPLALAKYASTFSLLVSVGWIVVLFLRINWDNNSVGRLIIESILSIMAFLGLFWNSYFISAMFLKCFIPAKAFKTNTKYCSIIPEPKPAEANWLNVTIQIPVYKESLYEVLMPTLKSCQTARDHYTKTTTGRCNIVVCDDGMMAMLRDNFPAAELLWKSVQDTQGRVVRLSRLLSNVPRASRRHLKGLRSKDVYEVFHRMLYYYHYNIAFVARSTVDRRGKFKKASNLNSHLRLALGAQQVVDGGEVDMETALLDEAHNPDGSRYVMFGNDVGIGDLICINDADARMAETVIGKTVPEFLNDPALGFTQHATKTMTEQRSENYFTNLLAVYTDALYMGHFLLSSIMGTHPPLVGHSIFLRTDALSQCGRMRTLRNAQRWLRNIGMPFLPVDHIGFGNLQAHNRTEYWSERHVSEDFELMIHFYNLGFNGRYCAYPDCEFQEGITRTFDEEAGRHRKFSLGAHELVFNPFQEMMGHGIFTPLFRTFLSCDIPSYYKVFLTAYLCSYSSGGTYIFVFTASAIVRLLDSGEIKSLQDVYFSPASIVILNFIIYFVLGYFTFLVSLLRMHYINNKLLFPEYRKKCCGAFYIVFTMLRYCLTFQFFFYNVATFSFYFLGSMDHLLSRPGIVSATNKDSIQISRCRAFWDMLQFNLGSWALALLMVGLGLSTVLQDIEWKIMDYEKLLNKDKIIQHAFFAGPPIFLAILAFAVPILLNPWILGWPFLRQPKKQLKRQESSRTVAKKDPLGREIVDIPTFMNAAKQLNHEIERVQNRPNVELGSLATKEAFTVGSPSSGDRKRVSNNLNFYLKPNASSNDRQGYRDEAIDRMNLGPGQQYLNPTGSGASGARGQRKNLAEEV